MLKFIAQWFSQYLDPQHNQQAALAGLVGKDKVDALLDEVELADEMYRNHMAIRGAVIRRVKEIAPNIGRIEREAAAALAILIWSDQLCENSVEESTV